MRRFVSSRRNALASMAIEYRATSLAEEMSPAAAPKWPGYAAGTSWPDGPSTYPRARFCSKAAGSNPVSAKLARSCTLGAVCCRSSGRTNVSTTCCAREAPPACAITAVSSSKRSPL